MVYRAALDTNTWISGVMNPHSVPAAAVRKALQECEILFSTETLAELREVMARPKFDRYVSHSRRMLFLRRIERKAKFCDTSTQIAACRDPKDNKFLSLAFDARADTLITGDNDLLTLHPFGDVQILKPADFLAL